MKKRILEESVIGIDISDDNFNYSVLCPSTQEECEAGGLPNSASGIEKLLSKMKDWGRAHVVMEATGTYHLCLAETLSRKGIRTSVINPIQTNHYGKAKRSQLKTDRADARLIAVYGCEQKPKDFRPDTPEQSELKQINTLLRQLMQQRTAVTNNLHAQEQRPHVSSVCKEILKQDLAHIEAQIAHLRTERKKPALKAYPATAELLLSITGIGIAATAALLAYLGDLTTFATPQQVSAFLGINPKPNQSGKRDAPRHISKQGSKPLRTLLYMCSLSASKCNKMCCALYERLIAKGKSVKAARIAVANKLIRQIFGVVKSGVPFRNEMVAPHPHLG